MAETKVAMGEAVKAEAVVVDLAVVVVAVAVETAVAFLVTIRPGRTRITNASVIVMGTIIIAQKFCITTTILPNITN